MESTFRPADVALARLLLDSGRPDDDVESRIAQIQRVSVTLAAIADNPDGLTFEEADIAILFVVTLCHLFKNSVGI